MIAGVVPASLAGRLIPDPVAVLTEDDLEQAAQSARPALAPVNGQTAPYQVRIDVASGRGARKAVLLRDGVEVATFRAGSVLVQVHPGDLLEVDATACRRPLTLVVVAASGLASPAVGHRLTAAGGIVVIGRVRPAPG